MADTIKAAKFLAQLWTTLKRPEVKPVGTTAEFSIIYEGEEYVVTLRHKPTWTMK